MSINEHGVKQGIKRHINSAKFAIRNKGSNLQWSKTVGKIADEISRLSRTTQNSMNNMQLKLAGGQYAFSIDQSITSEFDMLTDLDFYLLNEWKKVQDVLWCETKQLSLEGKDQGQDQDQAKLFDMLAGEVEAFDKLLRNNAGLINEILSNTKMKTEATIIKREISHLKALPQATTSSYLLMATIWLRLMPFLFVSKK